MADVFLIGGPLAGIQFILLAGIAAILVAVVAGCLCGPDDKD